MRTSTLIIAVGASVSIYDLNVNDYESYPLLHSSHPLILPIYLSSPGLNFVANVMRLL
jgi:hypothetical protein